MKKDYIAPETSMFYVQMTNAMMAGSFGLGGGGTPPEIQNVTVSDVVLEGDDVFTSRRRSQWDDDE